MDFIYEDNRKLIAPVEGNKSYKCPVVKYFKLTKFAIEDYRCV